MKSSIPHLQFLYTLTNLIIKAGGILLVLLVSVFLLQPAAPAHAQVLNIESLRMDADTTRSWAGNLTFGFSASKQDKQTIQLNNRATLIHFGKTHSYLMLTSINLVTIDDELVNNGYFHLRGTLWYHRRWSPEIFTQFQYSEDWGLKRRTLFGGGIRHNTIRKSGFTAGITTGLMYEHEIWSPEDFPRIMYDRIKSTTSLLTRGQLSPTTNLYIVGYYQAEPQKFLSPRLTANVELRFQVSRIVRFSAQFTTTYDYNPPPGVQSWIYTVRNNFSVLF